MEAYLDGIPHSAPSFARPKRARVDDERTHPGSPDTLTQTIEDAAGIAHSSYWLGGVSAVWAGLKDAAKVEVKGFLDAVRQSTRTPHAGDKRPGCSQQAELDEGVKKRRRLDRGSDHGDAAAPSYADSLMYTNEFAAPTRTACHQEGGGGVARRRRFDAKGSSSTSSRPFRRGDGESVTTARSFNLSTRENHRTSVAQVGLARPKSPTTRFANRERTIPADDALLGTAVSQVCKAARLFEPAATRDAARFAAPSGSLQTPFKPPRPTPPAPRQARSPGHPLLFSARASLRATPPRVSQTRTPSSSTDGQAIQGTDSFLHELGEKRSKLRKVSIETTTERRPDEGAGELQKALARKFAKSNGLAPPSFDIPRGANVSGSRSSSDLLCVQSSHKVLGSSAEKDATCRSLSASQSQPGRLSSRGVDRALSKSVSSPDSRHDFARRPRSTSLACTETTVFGQALTIDEPSGGAAPTPRRIRSHYALSKTTATPSPSPALPTDPESPRSERRRSHSPQPEGLSTIDPTRPLHRDEKLAQNLSGSRRDGQDDAVTTERAANRLPGLDAGTKRPVTPARQAAAAKRRTPTAQAE